MRAQQRIGVSRARGGDGHLDLAHVHIELFSNQHGQRGVNALPHFGACGEQRDGVVIGNVYPGVGRVQRAGGVAGA